MLALFGHREGIEEFRLVKIIVGSDVRGVNSRGRPRICWMDDVKRNLNARENGARKNDYA